VCVKSGVLCPRCQSLVDSGKVGREEVGVMRALIEAEENDSEFKWLKKTRYVKSYFADDMVVVVLEAGGVSPYQVMRLARRLGELLGKKVKVVTSQGDAKTMVGQILYPARVSGINTLWLPDGSTRYTVRVPRYELKHLPAPAETIENILSQILKIPVRIKAE